jgi:hypothetical protein
MAPQDTGQPATRYSRADQGAGRPAGASATAVLAPGARRAGTRQAGRAQPAVRQPAVRRPLPAPPAAGDAAVRQPGVRQPGLRRPVTSRPAPARPAPGQRSLTLPGAGPDAGLAPVTAARVPRTRFILLVLGMLGGGLVCLLVINTTLATASFRINALQHGNAALAQQEQSLQQQVATEESPSSLEQRARKLGLRTQPLLNVLNLRTGHIYRQPATLPGIPNVPGYAP